MEIENAKSALPVPADPGEMTLRDILQDNQFAENDKMLDSEIGELTMLYDLSKSILMDEAGIGKKDDQTRPARLGTAAASSPKRNMMFISNQTGNLIAMRKLMMDLIGKKADLKRDTLDRSIKALIQIAKEKKEEGDDSGKILDFLVNNLRLTIPVAVPQGGLTLPVNEQDIDDELDRRLEAEDADFVEVKKRDENVFSPASMELEKEPTIRETLDGNGCRLVYSQADETFYVVNRDYEVLETLTEADLDVKETEDERVYDAKRGCFIEILDDTPEE